MMEVIFNLSTYLDYIALETASPSWNTILLQFDVFFRRLPVFLPAQCDMSPVLKIIISTLKIPGLSAVKVSPWKQVFNPDLPLPMALFL